MLRIHHKTRKWNRNLLCRQANFLRRTAHPCFELVVWSQLSLNTDSLLMDTRRASSGSRWSLLTAKQRGNGRWVFSQRCSERSAEIGGVIARRVRVWIARDSCAHKWWSAWCRCEAERECSTTELMWNCVVRCECGNGFERREGYEHKELECLFGLFLQYETEPHKAWIKIFKFSLPFPFTPLTAMHYGLYMLTVALIIYLFLCS